MDTRAPSTARIEANLPLCVPLQSFAKPVIACHITTHLPETCPGAYCDEHSGPILELYAYSCLATLNAKSLTVSWAKTPTCFTPSSRCCVFGLKPSYFSNRNLPLGYLREPMSSPKKTMSSPKRCYFKEWTNQSFFPRHLFIGGVNSWVFQLHQVVLLLPIWSLQLEIPVREIRENNKSIPVIVRIKQSFWVPANWHESWVFLLGNSRKSPKRIVENWTPLMPGKSPNHSILSWREPCGVENPVQKNSMKLFYNTFNNLFDSVSKLFQHMIAAFSSH